MNYSKEALRTIFGKEDHFKKSISKNAILDIICEDAYKDMQPRHFKGIGNHKDAVQKIFDAMADRFMEYFESEAMEKDQFDEWHKSLCEELKAGFSKIDKLYGEKMTVGKAQKLINITFKELYLFSDTKDEKFQYCHVALDSYVLDWGKKNDILPKKKNYVWSNLNIDDYLEIQLLFRTKLKGDRFKNIPSIASEFYIWEEAKFDKKKDELWIASSRLEYWKYLLEDPYIINIFKEKGLDSQISNIKKGMEELENLF